MSAELPMIRMTLQRSSGDCSVAALAMYLGVSYEDALEAATAESLKPHRRGMYNTQIVKAAARLKVALVVKRRFSLEHDSGILSGYVFDGVRPSGHVVVLRWGLLIDPDGGELWEPDDYERTHQAEWTTLLTRSLGGR